MKKFFISFIALIMFLSSCEEKTSEPAQPYDAGVIVMNAGNYFDNNGTLSLLSRSSTTASLDIFQKENTRALAGSLTSYTEVGDKGIILVDNSTVGKDLIEIVSAKTFKSIASINNSIENPRNVIEVSATKAYITAWDATGDFSNFYKNPGYVAVLDLNTNTISKKINVQPGAESIQVSGNLAFVGSTGSFKDVLSIIDISTDTKLADLKVGSDPEVIGLDANQKLWIFAGGRFLKINPVSKMIESEVSLKSDNIDKSPSSFVFSSDKKTIFFTNSFYDAKDNYYQKGETYSFAITSTAVQATKPLIKKLHGGGLGVDPKTGYLYGGLIPSYKQAGFVFRYKPTGELIDSIKTEIAPSRFYFKKQ